MMGHVENGILSVHWIFPALNSTREIHREERKSSQNLSAIDVAGKFVLRSEYLHFAAPYAVDLYNWLRTARRGLRGG
jgi:hypothetical protein